MTFAVRRLGKQRAARDVARTSSSEGAAVEAAASTPRGGGGGARGASTRAVAPPSWTTTAVPSKELPTTTPPDVRPAALFRSGEAAESRWRMHTICVLFDKCEHRCTSLMIYIVTTFLRHLEHRWQLSLEAAPRQSPANVDKRPRSMFSAWTTPITASPPAARAFGELWGLALGRRGGVGGAQLAARCSSVGGSSILPPSPPPVSGPAASAARLGSQGSLRVYKPAPQAGRLVTVLDVALHPLTGQGFAGHPPKVPLTTKSINYHFDH